MEKTSDQHQDTSMADACSPEKAHGLNVPLVYPTALRVKGKAGTDAKDGVSNRSTKQSPESDPTKADPHDLDQA